MTRPEPIIRKEKAFSPSSLQRVIVGALVGILIFAVLAVLLFLSFFKDDGPPNPGEKTTPSTAYVPPQDTWPFPSPSDWEADKNDEVSAVSKNEADKYDEASANHEDDDDKHDEASVNHGNDDDKHDDDDDEYSTQNRYTVQKSSKKSNSLIKEKNQDKTSHASAQRKPRTEKRPHAKKNEQKTSTPKPYDKSTPDNPELVYPVYPIAEAKPESQDTKREDIFLVSEGQPEKKTPKKDAYTITDGPGYFVQFAAFEDNDGAQQYAKMIAHIVPIKVEVRKDARYAFIVSTPILASKELLEKIIRETQTHGISSLLRYTDPS